VKCEQVNRLIEDYSYGELENSLESGVARHLQTCRECSKLLEELAAEQKLYSSYAEVTSREVEPDSSLWSKVRTRLGNSVTGYPFTNFVQKNDPVGTPGEIGERVACHRISLRQLSFAAALVVVTIAATLVTLHYGGGDRKVSEQVGKTDSSCQSAMRSIERAEQEYLNAITILSALAEKRKPKLDARLAAELEHNLRIIDQAIAATSKAYRARPHDQDLAFYMLSAYRKKVDLLQELIS
jgi:hypothetical protein